MDRATVLETAAEYVCKDRDAQYGSAENNFALIGRLWTEYLHSIPDDGVNDDNITAHDVAIMMSLLKLARITTGKPKADNYIDLAGYIACAGEIACKEEVVPESVYAPDLPKLFKHTCDNCKYNRKYPFDCEACIEHNKWEYNECS